jgi:hypothetical protein
MTNYNKLIEICIWCQKNNAPKDVLQDLRITSQYIQALEALQNRVDVYLDNEDAHLAVLRRLIKIELEDELE